VDEKDRVSSRIYLCQTAGEKGLSSNTRKKKTLRGGKKRSGGARGSVHCVKLKNGPARQAGIPWVQQAQWSMREKQWGEKQGPWRMEKEKSAGYSPWEKGENLFPLGRGKKHTWGGANVGGGGEKLKKRKTKRWLPPRAAPSNLAKAEKKKGETCDQKPKQNGGSTVGLQSKNTKVYLCEKVGVERYQRKEEEPRSFPPLSVFWFRQVTHCAQ